MKSYEERTEYIISEIKKRSEARKKKRAVIERFTALAACFCFTVILGSHIFRQLEEIRKIPVMLPESPSAAELPDPRSVNDISAYVSQIIAMTNPDNAVAYTEKNASQIYITRTQTETNLSVGSKNITDKQVNSSLYSVTHTRKNTVTADTAINTHAVSSPATLNTTVSRRPTTTAITKGNEEYGGENEDGNGFAGTYDWDDMGVYQKFDTVVFNGMTYLTSCSTIAPESLIEKLGDVTASGTDTFKNETHYINAEIFRIENSSDDRRIAVKFEGYEEYYMYILV